jgi:predicted nucleotidyltransferase
VPRQASPAAARRSCRTLEPMPLTVTDFRAFVVAVAQAPSVAAIWLIGSRANGTERGESDWDLLVFGTQQTLAFLASSGSLHKSEVDLLVVTNGDDFQAAWGERSKHGSLSEWQWQQVSETEAQYMQAKWQEREEGSGVVVSQSRAVRVWPQNGL